MSKRIGYIILFLVIALFTIRYAMISTGANELRKESSEIIRKVESYKDSLGFYPENLELVGYKTTESEQFFYEKQNQNYIIWYGQELGESNVYHSNTKKWDKEF
jgi:glutaredoxin 2